VCHTFEIIPAHYDIRYDTHQYYNIKISTNQAKSKKWCKISDYEVLYFVFYKYMKFALFPVIKNKFYHLSY